VFDWYIPSLASPHCFSELRPLEAVSIHSYTIKVTFVSDDKEHRDGFAVIHKINLFPRSELASSFCLVSTRLVIYN
jgi:hypothetical protein